jgi:hypothetical protein
VCSCRKIYRDKEDWRRSYNKVFRLVFDTGAVVIARIPNPNAGPARYTTASEVATMEFVRIIDDSVYGASNSLTRSSFTTFSENPPLSRVYHLPLGRLRRKARCSNFLRKHVGRRHLTLPKISYQNRKGSLICLKWKTSGNSWYRTGILTGIGTN